MFLKITTPCIQYSYSIIYIMIFNILFPNFSPFVITMLLIHIVTVSIVSVSELPFSTGSFFSQVTLWNLSQKVLEIFSSFYENGTAVVALQCHIKMPLSQLS